MRVNVILLYFLGALALNAAEKLNIICVVTDDQSLWSVSCYGQQDIKTPHIDSLAEDGALFTNAFVNAPVCSPSRATFLTGKHNSRLGVTDWLSGGQAAKSGIDKENITWVELLRQNGYATGLIGKWHLGTGARSLPQANGFDYFEGNLSGGWSPNKNVFTNQDGEIRKIDGHSVNVCTDLALEFLKKNRAAPFALLVHYREPHAPYGPMPEVDENSTRGLKPKLPIYPNLKPSAQKLMRDYLTAVKAIDRSLGRILKQVDDLGLSENTIILFTSDHGYNMGHHGLRYKGNGYSLTTDQSGCRPNMFESSIRVPLLVRWPGVTQGGVTINQMTANVDTFASVLGILGVANIPENDGYDFSQLLRRESPSEWRDFVFGQYTMVNDAKHSMRMLRNSEWKLIRHYKTTGMDELYHLKSDPNEEVNLYDHPERKQIRERLQRQLDEKMKSLGDDPLGESPQG